MMIPKEAVAAAAALLSLLASPSSANPVEGGRSPWRPALRSLQSDRSNGRGEGKGKDGGGPPASGDGTPADESVECEVYLVLHSPPVEGGLSDDDAIAEPDGPGPLHCIVDDGEDGGGPRIFEIRGLDEGEERRVRDEVSADGGGGNHRFSFPGAMKRRGGGSGGGANVLSVPARGGGRRHQAVDVPPGREKKSKGRGDQYESDARGRRRRRLAIRHEGNSSVLLLRVEAPDASTTCSHVDCAANAFGGYYSSGAYDDMNLVTQIADCSYGKLRFLPPAHDPTYPDLVNGTATVVLDDNVTGVHHGTVLDLALAAAPAIVGSLDAYDHVMVYMPPGVAMGGAAAWGYVGGKYTWYHDGYRMMTGVHLHELGHNLGLGHSGESGGGYGDGSCYMGYGGGDVKMCFNAPKSHWLGWYKEFHQVFDPMETSSMFVELVGLADYEEAMNYGNPETLAIVLRIEMYEQQSLYLTYNRQEKMNIDVKEFQDQVTITRSNGPSQSWVEAGLNRGQKYHAPLVAGSGMMLEIVACDRAAGDPDTLAVSVHVVGVGERTCVPAPPIPGWGTAYAGPLSDALVGYYAFDDDLLDSSGLGHHGDVGGGAPAYSDGVVGRALSLDGVDDYVSLPQVPDFDFGTSDFTLTFWYRVSGDQSGSPAIVTNKDWNSGSNPGWLVSSNYGPGSNGDDISINLSDGSARADTSQALDVAFGSWHFVAVRIKRGEQMSLLRSSGVSYGLQEDSIEAVSGSVDTGLPILIGASHGYTAKTKMDIDDLGIWRRALSSEEVDAIFSAGHSGGTPLIQAMDPPVPPPEDPIPTNLTANYELELDLRDTSGNRLDATLNDNGGASYGTSDFGTHLSLNNIDVPAGTFVSLPDSDLLDFGNTTDFTVSFWHRTNVDFSLQSPTDPSILTNKNFASGENAGWTVGVRSNGRLEYNSGDGKGNRCDYDGPEGAMNDGQWHHVALSQHQGDSFYLFLDGKKVAHEICVLKTLSSGYPIRVGASWFYSAYYTGDVDKIMIYRSALSHANVFKLYGEGRQPVMTHSPTSSSAPTHNPTVPPTNAPTSPPTPQPTTSPLSCDGVFDNTFCCGSELVKQADYRGVISQTEGGLECQAWSSQSPHAHTRTPQNYPNSGLDANYCRNPDGEPRSWCYTESSGTRWDYCAVPVCGTMTSEPTMKPSSSPGTSDPTATPTVKPSTTSPSKAPIPAPTNDPTTEPTPAPSTSPSRTPSSSPSTSNPTALPTVGPSTSPSKAPIPAPSTSPSETPTIKPTNNPSDSPTLGPTTSPVESPTHSPSDNPTKVPTQTPTPIPTPNPTLNPSQSPETLSPTMGPTDGSTNEGGVCTGIDNSCCGSFWFGLKQEDYRGKLSKTVGGVECQPWSSQSPHVHSRTPANYPNAGLDQNYCRNPDGEPRAWCYTSSSATRWDYCDVPECPACESGDPSGCGCSEVNQADYRGTESYTVNGDECQEWSSQTPHGHNRTPENYPNAGLDQNYCRNPDGESRAWCYTKNPDRRWDYCGVRVCGE